ncbi:hypothetical protein EDM53_03690 [Rickettsiales endosymbiont of Peranema trichophorum]|uniref:hypothetical protein n=1 Tax=Rickettsiales endosymbiont of Peranema trichophorum TaxID=2486577 RepID=UPI001023E70C|nr:hypothetical protein [Rickettsiales endosymbiont of Peranema trichophorum]RZI46776.1 hypothetical protein EDM53_03690 [Rickettsiales endosymbiont of Peranema trichophorum]
MNDSDFSTSNFNTIEPEASESGISYFFNKHLIPSASDALRLDLPTNIVIPLVFLLTPMGGPIVPSALITGAIAKTAIATAVYTYRGICNQYWGQSLKDSIGDIGRAFVCGAPAGFVKYTSNKMVDRAVTGLFVGTQNAVVNGAVDVQNAVVNGAVDVQNGVGAIIKKFMHPGGVGAINNFLYEYYNNSSFYGPLAKVTVVETSDGITSYLVKMVDGSGGAHDIYGNFIAGLTMGSIATVNIWLEQYSRGAIDVYTHFKDGADVCRVQTIYIGIEETCGIEQTNESNLEPVFVSMAS